MVAELWAVFLVLLAAFCGSFGSVYFKKGADRLEFSLKSLMGNTDLMRGVLIYGSSTIFYVVGIKGGELSVLFPLVSTGYIWVCLLSVRILGERMNTLKWAGIAFILLGVSLIGLGG
ncbi:MAG: EamA family transporter [Candidatus Altiarchaeales archaeon]|nr:EamA family transporter [Candidatus Altiarchaeales archaeon]MBD3415653.1 EamA family transporter [Candidatus Altiarchaeales archaeon]